MKKVEVCREKPEKEVNSNDTIQRYNAFDPRTLVGFVGAVACYAWLFLALALPAFLPSNVAPDSLISACGHLCFVLGACISLSCVWQCADAFARHNGWCYALSAVCSVIGVIGLVFFGGEGTGICSTFNFFLGIGSGLLYPLYGDFISAHFYAQIKDYVHGFFACGVAVCCPLLFFERTVCLFFAVLFALAAYALYAVAQFVLGAGKRTVVEKAESDARQSVSWRSYLSTATATIACGFALGCLASYWGELTVAHYVFMIAIVLGICIALVVDSFHKQVINETLMMRFFLPVSAVATLPLLLVDDIWKPFFAVLLLGWSIVPISCSIVAMFKHVIICELATLRSFSLGRLVAFLGVFVGMGIAYTGFLPSVVGSSSLSHAVAIVVFILIVVFSTSFVMIEDNFPEEENFHIHNEDGETRVEIEPGTPIRKIDQSLSGSSAGQVVEEIVVSSSNIFQAKCDAVAQEYGLSNRQREVLAMLARGRNGDYITEKLVISPHTTKAHIYNIYQKTGVHSRQELMDLVENAEFDKERLCEIAKAEEE